MSIIYESEPVPLKVNGQIYQVYIRQYDDGDFDVEVAGSDDVPAIVYDRAVEYFEENGFFDGVSDSNGDFGDGA